MQNPIIPLYNMADKTMMSAKGCYQYDSEGKQYVDFESGDWAANLGHSHNKINEAIKKQVEISIHDGLRFRNKESEQLSLLLQEKAGIIGGKAVFLNSGSEAVNLGITIAKNITGRKKILKVEGTFLASYGHGQMRTDNQELINIKSDHFDLLNKIEFEEIAAFVFEPGNSHGLIKFPSNEFIKKVAGAVSSNGGLLMANEVTTGLGRTGKWFGFQYYDFSPDIVSVGKGLGNGYPISGVIINKDISEKFDKTPFRYAQSHQNDPLGCAVGISVIEAFEKERILANCVETGNYFIQRLMNLQSEFSSKIKEIRGRGLMIAMELESATLAENLYSQLLDEGFLVGLKENVLRFMPPLVIEKIQIDRLINQLREIFRKSF